MPDQYQGGRRIVIGGMSNRSGLFTAAEPPH
jgi:hypothetical protein